MEPPQPDHKPKPLGGAQFGNVNAVKTGHRSKRFGCVLARLGKRFGQPYVDVLRLRKKVEALLRERYGGLTLRQVARVQTLCRLEQSCRALELSIRDDRKMGTEELRGARHSICSWSRERDNVLRELLGDSNGHPGSDPWQALQTPPVPAPDPEDHPAPESVSEGVSGNDTADAEGSPP